jgi:hypothetical protein
LRHSSLLLAKLSHCWRFYHIGGIIAGGEGKVNIYHIFLVNYQHLGKQQTLLAHLVEMVYCYTLLFIKIKRSFQFPVTFSGIEKRFE